MFMFTENCIFYGGTPGNNDDDDHESADSSAAANAPKEYDKIKILCQHVPNLKEKMKKFCAERKSLIKYVSKLSNERDDTCRESSLETMQING